MALVRNRNVVDIPAVSSNIPRNPLLGYNGSRTSLPSASGSSGTSTTRKTLARRVLLYDQRCLVTGAASNQLQACHLVNAIRNKPNKRDKILLKAQVVGGLLLLIHCAITVKPSHLGIHSHPTTVRSWVFFLGQPVKLRCQRVFSLLVRHTETNTRTIT